MKWTGRTARHAPWAAARVVALAGMLAVSGLAAGAASASGGQPTAAQPTAVSLTYRCRFPSGSQPVTVAVTVSLPAVAATGKPIQPTGASLTMSLPPTAAASLHAVTVSAATKLTISASEGPSGASVVWPGITRRPVRRPARGALTLTTAGTVPPVTASSAGEVALTAAGLSVTFYAGRPAVPAPGPAQSPAPGRPLPNAGGRAAAPRSTASAPQPTGPAPRPTARPPLQVSCTLAPGQRAALGTVLITGKARRTAAKSGTPVGKCPKLPKGGLKFNPRFPLPPPIKAPGTKVIHFPEHACAFTTGYADARKLKGAVLLTAALTNVALTVREVVNFSSNVNFFEADNVAQLDFHGLHEFPPSTATFLTFGFVPTTAAVVLVEHGTINIVAVGPAVGTGCKPNKFQNCVTVATVSSRLSVQIVPGSVMVNGVPLDVGSQCQTPAFDAILTGSSASKPPYSVQFGGPLVGTVTIPKFKNCGVTENLDPIFDAAISGPKNFNLLTQGEVCFVQDALDCKPKVNTPVPPVPLRKVIG
jgi:hypothetical protein